MWVKENKNKKQPTVLIISENYENVLPTLKEQIREAITNLEIAEANYNDCAPVWEKVCFHEWAAAKERLNILLKEAKEGICS